LADVYNAGTGGSVFFTFNYVGGGSSTELVTLTNGVTGLQNFTFSGENDLSSVVFTATTTESPFIQFDDVGVSTDVSTTPLPSTWTGLIAGLVGVGFFAYRGTKKNSTALAS
jgi:hypothetical protein